MADKTITVTAVVFERGGLWIAQCLEYNLVGCAETKEKLPEELLRQVRAQVEADEEAGVAPFFGFKPAPAKYWKMFEAVRAERQPMRPKKRLTERVQEFFGGKAVDAKLFPVVHAEAA